MIAKVSCEEYVAVNLNKGSGLLKIYFQFEVSVLCSS